MVTADQKDSLRGLKMKMMAFGTVERPPSPPSSARVSQTELLEKTTAGEDFDESDDTSSGWGDSCSESSFAVDPITPLSRERTSVSHLSEGQVLEAIEAVFSKARTTIKAPELVSRSIEKKVRTSEIDAWIENQFRLEDGVVMFQPVDEHIVEDDSEEQFTEHNITKSPKTSGLLGTPYLCQSDHEKDDDLIKRLRASLSLPSKRSSVDEKVESNLHELRAGQRSRESVPYTVKSLLTLASAESEKRGSGDDGQLLSKAPPNMDPSAASCVSMHGSLSSNVGNAFSKDQIVVEKSFSSKQAKAEDCGSTTNCVLNENRLFASAENKDCLDNMEPHEFINYLTKKSCARLADISRPREPEDTDPEIVKGSESCALNKPTHLDLMSR